MTEEAREFRLAELLAAVKQAPLLTAELVPTDCTHGMHFHASLTDLLDHLCGEVSMVEMCLVASAVQKELIRQHPWLLGISLPKPDSWAWLWAWLDAMELKHGATHPIEPLPANWRGSIKLASYATLALNMETGEPREVTWADLPEVLQDHLRSLGYDGTP